jgi:hypothetical protein
MRRKKARPLRVSFHSSGFVYPSPDKKASLRGSRSSRAYRSSGVRVFIIIVVFIIVVVVIAVALTPSMSCDLCRVSSQREETRRMRIEKEEECGYVPTRDAM